MIDTSKEKALFKNLITVRQTKQEKALCNTLMTGLFACVSLTFYLALQEAWLFVAAYLMLSLGVLCAALTASGAFSAKIIRKHYPQHYRGWNRWCSKGIRNVSIQNLQDLFQQENITADRRALIVSRIDEEIKKHEKYEANLQTIALVIASGLAGALFTGIKPIITDERIILFTLALLFYIIFKFARKLLQLRGMLSGIDDLKVLRHLIDEVAFASGQFTFERSSDPSKEYTAANKCEAALAK